MFEALAGMKDRGAEVNMIEVTVVRPLSGNLFLCRASFLPRPAPSDQK